MKNHFKTSLLAITVALFCSLYATVAFADGERADHYAGLEANSLDEALKNFKTYNEKLKLVLAKEKLSAEDLNQIHQMSYTIENALQKMTEESGKIAEALESVHLGSEMLDEQRVKLLGEFYLAQSEKLYGK